MAVDKLVDSAQLDADLTSVADAIRLKSGGSSPLSFPAGFISEIANIPAGYTASDWLDRSKPAGPVSSDVAITYSNRASYTYMMAHRTGVTHMSLPNAAYISQGLFIGCTGLTGVSLPEVTELAASSFQDSGIINIALPKGGISATANTNAFLNCSQLQKVDVAGDLNASYTFRYCSSLSELILRKTSVVTITGNTFANAPAASGGAGITVYIPKSLYDHLGDGSALDYKANSTWNALTITWAQIEGSYYEDHYADGTLITP